MLLARCALVALFALWLIPQVKAVPTVRRANCTAILYLSPSALAVAPDGALLAGSGQALPQDDPSSVFQRYQGQVYRSTDPTHSCFIPLAAHPLPTLVRTLLVPPGHPAWILAGGRDVNGESTDLYLSQDHGRTWRNALVSLHVRRPIVPRSLQVAADGTLVLTYICEQIKPREGLVACGTGLASSRDGGLSWQNIPPPPGTTVLEVALLGNHHLFAIVYTGPYLVLFPYSYTTGPLRAFASGDAGTSWQASTIPPHALEQFQVLWGIPWAAKTLLTSYDASAATLTLYRSLDSGRRWTVTQHLASRSPLASVTLSYIGLSATHTILRQDYQELYRSADDGATWTRLYPPPHTSFMTAFHSFVYSVAAAPDGKTAYFAAGTGGTAHLYRTRDGGLTWQPLN